MACECCISNAPVSLVLLDCQHPAAIAFTREAGAHPRSLQSSYSEDLRDTSLTIELNLSSIGPHPRVKLGCAGDEQRKMSGKGQGRLKLSGNGNECRPLARGGPRQQRGRGLHSFTFQLNLSRI